jgi:hypothetical protein
MLRIRLLYLWLVTLVLVFPACATVARSAQPEQPLIVLLTDYGERDQYVGALKGAIYSADPYARIDSITNQISNFDIAEGAFILSEAAQEFPEGTIFVAIVDPGVGSERKGIAIRTERDKIFIGPDNGLLSIAAAKEGIVEVRELTNKELMRPGQVSNTFHGRDIFGPVAGHLAAGAPFDSVGPTLPAIVELSVPKAKLKGTELTGVIIHIDEYGDIVTNIPIAMVEKSGMSPGQYALVSIANKKFSARFVKTYSDVPEGAAVFLNNKGMVETALNMRNLASAVGAKSGAEVSIIPLSGAKPPVSAPAEENPE